MGGGISGGLRWVGSWLGYRKRMHALVSGDKTTSVSGIGEERERSSSIWR